MELCAFLVVHNDLRWNCASLFLIVGEIVCAFGIPL